MQSPRRSPQAPRRQWRPLGRRQLKENNRPRLTHSQKVLHEDPDNGALDEVGSRRTAPHSLVVTATAELTSTRTPSPRHRPRHLPAQPALSPHGGDERSAGLSLAGGARRAGAEALIGLESGAELRLGRSLAAALRGQAGADAALGRGGRVA